MLKLLTFDVNEAVVNAAREWTRASLENDDVVLREAFNSLVVATMEDGSREGDLLFQSKLYDCWPDIFDKI